MTPPMISPKCANATAPAISLVIARARRNVFQAVVLGESPLMTGLAPAGSRRSLGIGSRVGLEMRLALSLEGVPVPIWSLINDDGVSVMLGGRLFEVKRVSVHDLTRLRIPGWSGTWSDDADWSVGELACVLESATLGQCLSQLIVTPGIMQRPRGVRSSVFWAANLQNATYKMYKG